MEDVGLEGDGGVEGLALQPSGRTCAIVGKADKGLGGQINQVGEDAIQILQTKIKAEHAVMLCPVTPSEHSHMAWPRSRDGAESLYWKLKDK